jgi:hypothetical protein
MEYLYLRKWCHFYPIFRTRRAAKADPTIETLAISMMTVILNSEN